VLDGGTSIEGHSFLIWRT